MAHMPVHLSICQTEDDRLISDKGLVMALCIADRLLLLTAVRQFVPDSTRTPLFVRMSFVQKSGIFIDRR